MNKTARFLFCLPLLLLLLNCTGGKKTHTRSADSLVNPASQVDVVSEPNYIARDRRHTEQVLLKDAYLLYERGRELYEIGFLDEARLYFAEALDLLDSSGVDLEENPKLEQAFYAISSGVDRMELQLLTETEEPPLPELDEPKDLLSPLDEIAAVNLYAIEVDPALEDLVSEDLKNQKFDFPVVVNEQVLKFLDYYQGRGRKSMEEALVRSGRYLDRFREIFEEEGLPLDLIYMAHVESLFKPKAYSRARARGMWQFVAGTAKLYDLKVDWWLDERLDVYKATRSAARHLRDLNEDFGDWYLALAGYNGGPGRVTRVFRRHGKMDYWTMAKKRLLPRETRNYVPSILAAIIIYRNPERYGFFVEKDRPVEFEQLELEYQFDLGVIAESIGVPQEVIADLNPELLRGVTPSDPEGYFLKVPPGTGGLLQKKLAEVPANKRIRLKHHKVRNGETLSHIASRYGVSIRAIADVNRIRNVNRLKLGQDLIIPLSYSSVEEASYNVDPNAQKHVVRRGDSLYKIAHSYGVPLQDLFRWNGLAPGAVIHPGQEIYLSSGAAQGLAGGRK